MIARLDFRLLWFLLLCGSQVSPIRAASNPQLLVAPCERQLAFTLRIEGAAPLSGFWCDGVGSEAILSSTDEARELRLVRRTDREQLDLCITSSDQSKTLWTGDDLEQAEGGWQPLESQPGQPRAQLQIQRRADRMQGIAVRAVDQPAAAVLAEVLRVTGLKLSGFRPSATKMTLHLNDIPAAAIIQLLYMDDQAALLYGADGSITMARQRDAERVLKLQARLAEVQSSASVDPERSLPLLEELRALVRLRGPDDAPADASEQLEQLAELYRNDSRKDDRVALRREMLALHLRYDQRPHVRLGMAHMRLAEALQDAEGADAEVGRLMDVAEPLLLAGFQHLDLVQLCAAARALLRAGRAASAVILLEAAMSEVDGQSEGAAWVTDADYPSWYLLLAYRKLGREASAKALLERWSREVASYPVAQDEYRVVGMVSHLTKGRFAQAAFESELMFARLPPFTLIDDQAFRTFALVGMQAHLGAGQYRRAAELYALVLKREAAIVTSPERIARLVEMQAEQGWLARMANVVTAPDDAPTLWNARYRSEELARAADPPADEESARMMRLIVYGVTLLNELTEQWSKQSPPSAELIAAREHVAPLLVLVNAGEPNPQSAAALQIEVTLEARRAAGADDAQLASRRQQLQRWLDAAQRETLALQADSAED